MALVQNSWNGDFLLYQREQSLLDMNEHPSHDMLSYGLSGDNFDAMAATSYESATSVPASFMDPTNSHFLLGQPREYEEQLMQHARQQQQQQQQQPTIFTPTDSPATSFTHTFDQSASTYSHTPAASAQSATSSCMNSPYTQPTGNMPPHEHWQMESHGIELGSTMPQANYAQAQCEGEPGYSSSFVDPSLISAYDPTQGLGASQIPTFLARPPSPVPSNSSQHASVGPMSRHASPAVQGGLGAPSSLDSMSRHASPSLQGSSVWEPYPTNRSVYGLPVTREPASPYDQTQTSGGGNRGMCVKCRRGFKDLKAHMLTHQSERPEKCPVVACEYHTKGFARKYDRSRHTLTHYKGTMVCDFCPGGGSAAEKSFNRADVFKRHLMKVHGVERDAPNNRRSKGGSARGASSPRRAALASDTSGKCSTCSTVFSNAQELYDHLDDCVLKSLEQEEPSEAINAQHLAGVSRSPAVQDELERHSLPLDAHGLDAGAASDKGGDDEYNNDDEDDEDDEDDASDASDSAAQQPAGASRPAKARGDSS